MADCGAVGGEGGGSLSGLTCAVVMYVQLRRLRLHSTRPFSCSKGKNSGAKDALVRSFVRRKEEGPVLPRRRTRLFTITMTDEGY